MSQESTPVRPDQMAPHSVEAEEAVLGAILLNANELYRVVGKISADDFFIVRNGWVWEAIEHLSAGGLSVDYITVIEELRQKERLIEIGGAPYITYLINHTPSSLYVETYAEIVRRAAIRRKLISAASTIAREAHSETDDIYAVIEKSEEALFNVTSAARPQQVAPAWQIADETYEAVSEAYAKHQRGEVVGVPTGMRELDDLLGGLQKSDLIIVAARPGMGKTSWLLSVMLNAARAKTPTALFSLEMNRQQIQQRLVSMDTGISTHKLRTGALSAREYSLFVEANARIGELPYWIDATPAHNIAAMASQAKRLYFEHEIGLVLVDYLQLATAPQARNGNRTQEVGAVSRGLKQIARELNAPVIAAAQLSRECENRADKRPILPDLRDSGEIEQDSDAVLFIYRDVMYNPGTASPNSAEMLIAKHRNGPTGKVELYFRKETTQFATLIRTPLDLAAVND